MMPRFFFIVLDGVGAGHAPDAADYGDEGASTLEGIAHAEGGLMLPNMQRMGLGNIVSLAGVPPSDNPCASYGLGQERSRGKDTITGHWEMMGIITKTPFPTYPDGFPAEVLDAFEKATGVTPLWGKVAAGTTIIEKLGDEHMSSGKPIVYTSADSVFQIAAHEDVIPPEELYVICQRAREILITPHNLCRVIARPFDGPPYIRTPRRRDYPVEPPEQTAIDLLAGAGIDVVSVGKVSDMFNGRGFSETIKTVSNADGMDKLSQLQQTQKEGFVFANLVDFDTLWGHRNDTAGFRVALEEFDLWLGGFADKLLNDDYLIITADHGLDPTYPGTDHTREQVPLLFYGKPVIPKALGVRDGFMDMGATVLEALGLDERVGGRSLLL
jgi:phosphopentomutase